MIKDLVKTKDKVRFVLRRHPETRDCDKKLWLEYMCYFHNMHGKLRSGGNPYQKFVDLFLDNDTPAMESIRRVRQKIQEGGEYVGNKRKYRMDESEEVREWALGNGSF